MTTSRFTTLIEIPSRASRLPEIGGRKPFAPRVLALWHLTSLDAPTVAVVWTLSFAQVTGVRLPVWVLVLVGLVVWAVYVADRLLDARAGLKKAELKKAKIEKVEIETLRERHYFHWRHRRVLVPLALFAACLAAWMVLRFMPAVARERDSMLAVAATAYFAGVHGCDGRVPFLSRLLSKELLVGMLFTCGCAMPSWVRGPFLPLLGPVIFFAALAWLNCFAIDGWESAEVDGVGWPIAKIAFAIGALGLLAAACMAGMQPRAAMLLAAGAVSALLLAGLDRARRGLDAVTLRAAADLVLLTPAVIAWVGR